MPGDKISQGLMCTTSDSLLFFCNEVVKRDYLVISKNGKTCAVTEKAKDSKGPEVIDIEVNDKH
jgi:hypothetical protein